MNDHINKPIEPEIFYRMLEDYYHNKTRETQGNPTESLSMEISSSEFPAIEGLDVGNALRRIGGMTRLYHKLLTQFVEGYRFAVEELSSEIRAENWEVSLRQAHTLKGLLGTIGAEKLQTMAAAIEKALKNQDVGSAKQTIVLLEHPFAALINNIADALDALPDESPKPAVAENDTSTEWVSRFRELIELNDIESVDMWRAKKASLSAALSSDIINQITEAIEGFDFDAAAQLLKEHLPES
ncbi:MAG: Hpt domain-containing protein [Desulfobacteraceae bacterium]|nr:Hpt domain-containing protein [Desulfobacteraceae bacterium]